MTSFKYPFTVLPIKTPGPFHQWFALSPGLHLHVVNIHPYSLTSKYRWKTFDNATCITTLMRRPDNLVRDKMAAIVWRGSEVLIRKKRMSCHKQHNHIELSKKKNCAEIRLIQTAHIHTITTCTISNGQAKSTTNEIVPCSSCTTLKIKAFHLTERFPCRSPSSADNSCDIFSHVTVLVLCFSATTGALNHSACAPDNAVRLARCDFLGYLVEKRGVGILSTHQPFRSCAEIYPFSNISSDKFSGFSK